MASLASDCQKRKATKFDSSTLGAWCNEYPWLEPLDQLLQERHVELLRSFEEWLVKMRVGGVVLDAQSNPEADELMHAGRQESPEPLLPEDTSEAGSASIAAQKLDSNFTRLTSDFDYETRAEKRSLQRQRTRETKFLQNADTKTETSCHRRLVDLVESKSFEGFFAILIITNSFVIGAQVEHSSHYIHSLESPLFFRVLEQLYASFFFLELVLRMAAGGRQFFCSSDMSALFWSYFDILIVGSSVFELVLQIVAAADSGGQDNTSGLTGQAKILRIVRITRVIRVMRVLRVVKFIRALASLISSIFYTLKSLAWSLFLLLMIIYVFGILFADTVISHVADFPQKDELDKTSEEYELYSCFGSLLISMHTLFRSISGGLDWGQQINLLFHIHWVWGYLFLAYIAFCYFAVLNVMTAVFCQRAIESSRYDPDYQIQQMLAEQERCSEICAQLFLILDSIADGTITRAELVEHFDEDAVRALFQSLDLVASDPWALFKLLDAEGNGDIDYGEFMAGCMKMRGPAKAVDIAWMMHENKRLKQHVTSLSTLCHTLAMDMQGITTSLDGLRATVISNHGMPTCREPEVASKTEMGKESEEYEEDDEDTENDRCSGQTKTDEEDSGDTPRPPVLLLGNPPGPPPEFSPDDMAGLRAAGFAIQPEKKRCTSWQRQARQPDLRQRGLTADAEDIHYDVGPELQVQLPGTLPGA
eukprot:TRINITY_DN13565_c0_g1_i1.p1 TRINITY_DN13565_c0_g1~~TRINITY_DN13565_c0_g1_i1.p1  ORF type:complete len:705 (-),score=126.99 TRINITY_DN13565_c0_g1_i1:129-2243(-)